MKRSEKTLVGVLLLLGGVALASLIGLPRWEALSDIQSQITALNDEVKMLDTRKTSLNAEIAQLEKNSIIPADIEVQVYTEKNREQIIKGLLDRVVNLATDAGNLLISLAPADEKNAPLPPKLTTGDKNTSKSPTDSSTTSTEAAPTSPTLNQFSYELSVRGTYNAIQAFLRAMAKQKALIEISAIKLENEITGGQPVADSGADPFHPIRMAATIRLALQPSTPK